MARPFGGAKTMPWRVGTMSDVRLSFVQEILVLQQSVTAACRKYGISRKTGYKWLKRYQAGCAEDLADRSRRPQYSPERTAPELEQQVLHVRDTFGDRKSTRLNSSHLGISYAVFCLKKKKHKKKHTDTQHNK